MRRFIYALVALCIVTWGTALYFFVGKPNFAATTELPTQILLPSLTSSSTATETPTSTSTATATPTSTSTATASPTLTPTLSTRVIEISAVMPGVYQPPAPTRFPFGTILLSAPPNPVEPLPDATNEPAPYVGWYSFESDHPNVHYSLPWEPRLNASASQGQYHRSENIQSAAAFTFEGEGLRIRYVAASNMGLFQIVVDGVVIDTIDAYAPQLVFPSTRVYFVGGGVHTLELRSAQQHNPQSEGYVLALDAIQVFRGDAHTLIIPPPLETNTPTPAPQLAAEIELVSAPPTVRPTTTPIPPALVRVAVVIAYDENGNRSVEPAEGVASISVRVVEVGTNRVITQALTDTRGYAQLQVITVAQARVVVPYFGEFWDIPRSRANGEAQFTLLLSPANQPGLIP